MSAALLLDTHALLWWVQRSSRLGRGAIALIESSPTVFFSAVSIFEIELKRDRLGFLPDDYLEIIQATGFKELSFTAPAARMLSGSPPELTDPFDRALLAQAREFRVPLLTADRRILDASPDDTVAIS